MDTEQKPHLDNEVSAKLSRTEMSSSSPPPNCAICLGACANKCFTNCCLHQFCFNCLLEWSKIKAECPLCKQPFKSIIYNIKSISEYEEHHITNTEREIPDDDYILEVNHHQDDLDPVHLLLPNGPRPQRHFQFRTTLTVDPGGELAIQQLLLSHPLTNTLLLPTSRYTRMPQQTISFRRTVYQNGWWVYAPPDLSGRYRECTPTFFRENPAQTHRIIPWLNRELSALLTDYVDMFVLQESIMEMLCQYPIHSASFRTRIVGYLGTKTDHFLHEFYNFVRSPYDMIGYDRHVRYIQHQPAPIENIDIPTHSLSDDDDDSDVRVIDSPNDCVYIPPPTPEVIVINSDSDSDVIIREPTPPIVVDLANSDSEDNNNPVSVQRQSGGETMETPPEPKLPIKLRLKFRNPSPPPRKRRGRILKRQFSSSSSNSDTSSSRSRSVADSRLSDSSYSSSGEDCASSSGDWIPVKSECKKYTQPLVLKRKKTKSETSRTKALKKKYNVKKFILKSKYKREDYSDADYSDDKGYRTKKSRKCSKPKKSKKRDSDYKLKKSRFKKSRHDSGSECYDDKFINITKSNPVDSDDQVNLNSKSDFVTNEPEHLLEVPLGDSVLQSEEVSCSRNSDYDIEQNVAGPSSGGTLRSVVVKANNIWFSRPDLADASTDNNSD